MSSVSAVAKKPTEIETLREIRFKEWWNSCTTVIESGDFKRRHTDYCILLQVTGAMDEPTKSVDFSHLVEICCQISAISRVESLSGFGALSIPAQKSTAVPMA